jgi:catechol 2,3-dioxygenase-like lactoylglutathione lyase family enzyme
MAQARLPAHAEDEAMAITLNHTIVPAHDKIASARFLAQLFGLGVEEMSHFAAVRINDTLTLDYDNWDAFEPHHYAFQVGADEFEQIFARVKAAGLSYSADPHHRVIGQIYNRGGVRGFYFLDPNRHIMEVLSQEKSDGH